MSPPDRPDALAARLTFPSDPAKLADVRRTIRASAERCGFAESEVDAIALAIDEALANVIKHGYAGRTDGRIDLEVRSLDSTAGSGIEIYIRDYGCQIDPTKIAGRKLDDVRPGGLGVHIIRSIMDEVVYAPCRDCGMSVTLRKYLGQRKGTTTE
jgi:anti-sigma regulatory factor (Ser/Thr protein kinase)